MLLEPEIIIHLVGGGLSGTLGAIVTCPLEVVKTRLQSSTFYPPSNQEFASGHVTCKTFPNRPQRRLCTGEPPRYSMALSHYGTSRGSPHPHEPPGMIQCFKYIIKNEGSRALFKGLGPNLVGVAPSRAIYFCTYSQSKAFFNSRLPPDSHIVHVFSAFCAGFVTSTTMNPVWFIKTRLQLDHHSDRTSAIECIRRIYRKSGFLGFYKGIVASYVGISETVVYFVIYESLKSWLQTYGSKVSIDDDSMTPLEYFHFMAAGAFSKTCACCIAYPHEVVRTRLREEGTKYRGFWKTLYTIRAEEGVRGMYRGLKTQLIRQIPNSAIIMVTYEAVVYFLRRRFQPAENVTDATTQFYAEAKPKRELA